MDNIVLCGFMGCGKTTVGRLLAKKLSLKFLDADDYIAEKQQMPIVEIFSHYGEGYFRDVEHEALKDISTKKGYILATGGGALTFERNIPPLKAHGVIIFLNPGFEECYRRISGSQRPLVSASTKEQLRELHNRREPLYRAACDLETCASGGHTEWAEVIISGLTYTN